MCEHKRIRRIGILAVCLLLAGSAILASEESAGDKKTQAYGTEDTSRYEVQTNRHTRYVEPEEAACLLTTEGFEEKLNNGTISVWYGKETEALRIVDLRSGYIWGCIDDNEMYALNKKWSQRAMSMLYISYFNTEGKEESCALSEGTFQPTYNWEKDRFSCNVSAKKLGISFTFTVSIADEKLTFCIEDTSIEETGKSKLSKVSFMSFLGSVYEDTVPGYVMVPDGSGALIRFAKAKSYQSGYSRSVYGNDLALNKNSILSNLNGNRTDDYATEEHQMFLPLWGMVHGEEQNGFLVTVDSGELYAVINATPAGAENASVKFTRAYAEFVYRCQYNKRVSNSKVVAQPQEERNEVNPMLTYTFLTGENADYSGMAAEYRDQLQERGLLPENAAETDGDISLLLHVVGSEVKKGFLKNKVTTLTTAEQAQDMVDRLREEGVTNISMLLSGWSKGGYHGASYGNLKFNKKVGGRSEIQELRDTVERNGGHFALVLNAVTANKDQISISRDVALDATLNEMVETIPNKNLMYPDTYYLMHNRITSFLEKAFVELEDYDLLLEGMGKYLYSDYTVHAELSRDGVQREFMETMEKAGQEIVLDAWNQYMLKYASTLVELPVSNSQYVYETDSIPFLQMVLRDSVDCYAPYSNQGFYSGASILKMIEYGVYPSFMVMEADNFSLNDTPLENCFSLNFEDWEERIHDVYGKVNGALSYVKGAAITEHSVEAEGVYCTVYDNGVRIFVNYDMEDYVTEEGITVPAGSYAVEE